MARIRLSLVTIMRWSTLLTLHTFGWKEIGELSGLLKSQTRSKFYCGALLVDVFRFGLDCSEKVCSAPITAFCNDSFENEWHLFFGCSKAQQVWEAMGLWESIAPDFEIAEGAVDLFFKLLDNFNSDAKIDLAAGLWCIWKLRNDCDRSIVAALHEVRSFIAGWTYQRSTSQRSSPQQQRTSSAD